MKPLGTLQRKLRSQNQDTPTLNLLVSNGVLVSQGGVRLDASPSSLGVRARCPSLRSPARGHGKSSCGPGSS